MKKIGYLFLLSSFSFFGQDRLDLFFDFNAAVPNSSSHQQLEEWLLSHPKIEILSLSGYCDSVDDTSYNKDLALRRIQTIEQRLQAQQVVFSKNYTAQAIGKNFKQSPNQDENRKVSISYRFLEQDSEVEYTSFAELNAAVDEEKKQLLDQIKRAKIGDLVTIQNIHFELNKETIIRASQPLLDELLQIMLDYPQLYIEIHGHICCNSDIFDTKLSARRAMKISSYLRQYGIDKNRITPKGMGSVRPLYSIPERNEYERGANRRVEILIVKK